MDIELQLKLDKIIELLGTLVKSQANYTQEQEMKGDTVLYCMSIPLVLKKSKSALTICVTMLEQPDTKPMLNASVYKQVDRFIVETLAVSQILDSLKMYQGADQLQIFVGNENLNRYLSGEVVSLDEALQSKIAYLIELLKSYKGYKIHSGNDAPTYVLKRLAQKAIALQNKIEKAEEKNNEHGS